MEYSINVEPNVNIFVNDLNPMGNKTILFIHGWPASNEMFEYQYNQLMATGYRLIGVDTRGFGDSSKPQHGYDYDRLADDIKCVIDTLGLQNIILLGHSTGGAIAVRYMARYNGYGVSKLVLCAAATPSLVKRPNFPYGVDESVVTNIIKATYADRPKMLRDFGDIFFYQKVTKPFSDWFFNLGLKASSWATIAISEDWLVEEMFYDLSKIVVPTLIMHGVHDQVVPYQLALVQNQSIINSKLITFDDSGHGLFYDQRDKFNKELLQFVEQF